MLFSSFLLLASAITRDPFPALMFVAMVSLLLLSGRTTREEVEGGEFSRKISPLELLEGDELTLEYSIRFESSRPRMVEIVQPLPGAFSREERTERFVVTGAARLAFKLDALSRGRQTFPPCRVRVSDLADITHLDISFGGETEVEVSSRVQKIDVDAIQPLHPKTIAGNRVSFFRGSGTEFYSLRRYVEGESIRRVNWKASAKSEDLWVNSFLAESSGTQIIVLDARLIESDTQLTREVTDMGIRAAISIAYSSLNERNAVGMFVISETSTVTKPDYGMRQFLRISETLKNVQFPTYRSPVRLHRMANVYGDAKAQYIVITPLVDTDTMDSVAELALSQEDVVVLVPLLESVERAEDPYEMAVTLTRLRQETNAVTISQLCRTISWRREEELSAAAGRARLVQVRRRL